jgi:putative oxidoreductase
VFGLWGGPGIGGFTQFLQTVGFQQANTLAWVTGIGELVGGAFVLLGLVTPLAAAGLLAIMINVVLLKLGNGFFVAGSVDAGGFELEAVLGLAAGALVLTGPGRIALDNGRAWHRRPASWGVLCLVIGIASAILIRVLLHR